MSRNALLCGLAATTLIACSDGGDDNPTVILGELSGPPPVIEQTLLELDATGASQTLDIGNEGTCPLSFSITTTTIDGSDWFTVTPASGTVATGSTASVTVDFDVATDTLVPGTYTGTITIVGACAGNGRSAVGSPASVAVNLTVMPLYATIAPADDSILQDVPSRIDQWTPIGTLRAPPAVSEASICVWTGYRMVVWNPVDQSGGLYDPLSDRWTSIEPDGHPDLLSFIAGTSQTYVWTGTELLTWGGVDGSVPNGTFNGGHAFDPISHTWRALPAGALGRAGHIAVWTGAEMIVWGGISYLEFLSSIVFTTSGERYIPGTDSWATMSGLGAPVAMSEPTAVWTGTHVFVWGDADYEAGIFSGGLYNPATDSWSPVSTVDSPQVAGTAHWTGREVVYFEAEGDNPPVWRYSPDLDRWSQFLPTGANGATRSWVWNGWGFYGFAYHQPTKTSALNIYWPPATGAVVDVLRHGTDVGEPTPRVNHCSVWTGSQMLLWGGEHYDGFNQERRDGGIYE